MNEFAAFIATRADTVDLTDPEALATAWRAWATLFDAVADEPDPGAFAELAQRNAAATRPDIERSTPLATWSYRGQLRRYQADVLERLAVVAGEPLHIVAPPGSGKTLLGIMLAMKHGRRAVALAPTTTIRTQWFETVETIEGASGAASEDPLAPGDFTLLTYQALSVLDTASPLEELATAAWRSELVGGGRGESDAAAWIADLKTANPAAHRSGIARRSRDIRRRLAQEDPAVLASALHPNARELVDRLVSHGVETIVLDECHHLLDHWAVVVAYLAGRIRLAGGIPLIIGLTATLPSTEDADEYDTYTSLLGDVDYEIPTPAVVKEGNLAPYRDIVWFTEPEPDELEFLRGHEQELAAIIRTLLATDDGVAFLAEVLQPDVGADPAQPLSPTARLAAAFESDFAVTEGAARLLVEIAPRHPLVRLLPREVHEGPSTEQSIRVLARFALDRLLRDPARSAEWDRVKRILVDFGYTLTDRGIRRARDPIDTVLASSLGKDKAVRDILHLELSRKEGFEVKAVVVTDFAVHGNRRGAEGGRAGALRCFDVIVADDRLGELRPVLVTAEHLRIAKRDADVLVPEFAKRLGIAALEPETVRGSPDVVQLPTPGAGSSDVVGAVSDLVSEGIVRLIVGTRGLLGEGWDCPAVNTLIDLTAVATSATTQQLRGRTLRLDPAWPAKVAHNWSVASVIPPGVKIDEQPDVKRLYRKHSRVWGLSRDDAMRIDRGITIALKGEQLGMLWGVLAKSPKTSIDELNRSIAAALPTRAQSLSDWRIGEPYADRETARAVVTTSRAAPFATGLSLEFVILTLLGVLAIAVPSLARLVIGAAAMDAVLGLFVGVLAIGFLIFATLPLLRMAWLTLRQHVNSAATYRNIVATLVRVLHQMGRIGEYGHGDIAVTVLKDGSGAVQVEAGLAAGPYEDQRLVADCMRELFGPVRSPRFLLQVNRGAPLEYRNPVVGIVLWMTRLLARRDRYLPVPTVIGRSAANARAFAAEWRKQVGPCVLHELDSPEALALVVEARRRSKGAPDAPIVRESWS